MDFKRAIFDKSLIFILTAMLIFGFTSYVSAEDVISHDDFGNFIKQGLVKQAKKFIINSKIKKSASNETKLPILMFHHIGEETDNTGIISEEKLYDLLKYIKDNNYNTVTFKELHSFVMEGKQLPKNPIMITIDDGYLSNYEKIFPLLKVNNQRATIFVIGSSVGKDTYKDTDYPIIPHFTMEQMLEMADSGLIDIGSHSYDMHQSKDLEKASSKIRLNALKLDEETEEEYISFFKDDFESFNLLYSQLNNGHVEMFAYPLGKKDNYSELLLEELGIKATFTTEKGNNTLVRGLPQSLFSLKRNNISQDTDIEKLLKDLTLVK